MPKRPNKIRRRALRLTQSKEHPLYLFSLTGEEVLKIADISRVSRNDAGKLIGYQRSEVKTHIQGIIQYLNGKDVLFPNPLILAMTSRVRFVSSRGPQVNDNGVTAGVLEIPLPRGGAKPAWIVDGQQRAIAISKSRRQDLLVPVNAFVADDVELQRDQFLRVNNTKPLPRGLITELLPEVSTPLPANLETRKIPSALCDLLNQDKNSPFYQLIRRVSTKSRDRAKAVVADTSIIKMLQESLGSPSGCLFPYRNIATGETDFDGIWRVLLTYWTAVKSVFSTSWGKPPSKSRLMHGAGIRAMGRLMDRVMASTDIKAVHALSHVKNELHSIAPLCRWTEGHWEDLDDMAWDQVQNVPRHIRLLTNFLIRVYVQRRGVAA